MLKISNKDYHAHKAIGSSQIRKILKSPYHFKSSLDEREPSSPALTLGSAIHAAVLEPNVFIGDFITVPEFTGTGSRAKKEEFSLLNADKTILTIEQFNTAQRCREAIEQNAMAASLLSNGEPELSFFTEINNVAVKCRPDYLRADKGLVIDIKSTTDANHNDFKKSVVAFGYHIQAAFYLDVLTQATGRPHNDFLIIAIEKGDPSPEKIGIYRISDAAIELGRLKVKQALEIYKKCSEQNYWPGYPQEVIDLDLPSWAYEIEEYLE